MVKAKRKSEEWLLAVGRGAGPACWRAAGAAGARPEYIIPQSDNPTANRQQTTDHMIQQQTHQPTPTTKKSIAENYGTPKKKR
jgi:hypothetical protein